jgi:periplasmic mercuric ion binding protein
MKTKILVLTVIFLIATASAFAEKKTEKVDVKGNCESCKIRIEKAAKSVDGVSKAKWDQNTKVLELTYENAKTDLTKIETAIAKVGHDTPLVKSSDDMYKKLPACCKYDRNSTKASSGSCTGH